MPSLPPNWRTQMTKMVSGHQPLEDSLFAGGPVLTPIQQIGVYRDQYRLRIYDALHDEVNGLAALLGDDLEALLWAYLEAHPSTSYTLNHIASELVPWLEARQVPVEQLEMARLDRAVQRGFEAANGTPLRPEDLGQMPDLKLAPAVGLLWHTTNVHDIRSASLNDGETPELETGIEVPLVIFRRDLRMRHWRVSPAMWKVLEAIDGGASVMDALGSVVEAGLVAPDELAAEVQQWFKDFVSLDLVQLRE